MHLHHVIYSAMSNNALQIAVIVKRENPIAQTLARARVDRVRTHQGTNGATLALAKDG